MQIDVIHIIIFLVGITIGSVLSWLICSKYYKLTWIKNAISVKNPELWDLAHFYIKDEEETNKYKKVNPKRQK